MVRADQRSSVKAGLNRKLHYLSLGTSLLPFVEGLLLEPPKKNREYPSSLVEWTDPAPREKPSNLGTLSSIGLIFILL